jgi:structural maintenance of chromosome 2|tara:strand:+ start:201 stop:581 length:381 start_codon:yes stop_codon:yes gene_type:complete
MEKIKNLFCSVKLNVNNPHFLIMQGRITKVINMKPVELLGLIEEAAGTSLYQHKREQAQNHIRKKELKQQEIDNILNSEVTPKLDQLKKDKNALDEYKSNVSQLERNEKTLIAFRYYDLSKLTEDP